MKHGTKSNAMYSPLSRSLASQTNMRMSFSVLSDCEPVGTEEEYVTTLLNLSLTAFSAEPDAVWRRSYAVMEPEPVTTNLLP